MKRGWRNADLGGGVAPGSVSESEVQRPGKSIAADFGYPVTKRSLHKPKQIELCTANGRLLLVPGSCSSKAESVSLESQYFSGALQLQLPQCNAPPSHSSYPFQLGAHLCFTPSQPPGMLTDMTHKHDPT